MILDEIIDNPTNCKIIVIGCGGHARSVVNSIIKKGCHKDILLIDNNAIIGEEILGQEQLLRMILQNRVHTLVCLQER